MSAARVRKGTQDDFRCRLAALLFDGVRDRSGCGLDKLERELRPEFGTRDGEGRLTSVLSKVAAFVKPQRFVAWDRYAKRGLNLALQRPVSEPFCCYAAYLAALDSVWRGDLGRRIRRLTRVSKVTVETTVGFQRRVLDVCLMKAGGRWDR